MIQLQSKAIKVTIAPKGAELKSILHLESKTEFLWQGDPTYWNRSSPVLFPIVGRLLGDTYTWQGTSYSMTQHGFARDRDFEIVTQSETEALLQLTSDAQSLGLYPFSFTLSIHYRIEENQLFVNYQVQNTGGTKMPFALGAHPGFNCPLEDGLVFEDYTVRFNQTETGARHLVTGPYFSGKTEPILEDTKELPLKYADFDSKDAIVLKELQSTQLSLSSPKGARALEFNFASWPFLALWTKPGPFLCIEPWTGHGDYLNHTGALEDKAHVQKLKPAEIARHQWSIRLF
jgi:galactose mutarotase-like enzyme